MVALCGQESGDSAAGGPLAAAAAAAAAGGPGGSLLATPMNSLVQGGQAGQRQQQDRDAVLASMVRVRVGGS